MGYSWPIQGNQKLICFTLFDQIYDLIDGWCAKSNQHLGSNVGLILYNQGHLNFIIASHPFYLNPYNNIAQGLEE